MAPTAAGTPGTAPMGGSTAMRPRRIKIGPKERVPKISSASAMEMSSPLPPSIAVSNVSSSGRFPAMRSPLCRILALSSQRAQPRMVYPMGAADGSWTCAARFDQHNSANERI